VTQDQTTTDTEVPELRWSPEQRVLLILHNRLPYVLFGRDEPAPPPWRYDVPTDAVRMAPAEPADWTIARVREALGTPDGRAVSVHAREMAAERDEARAQLAELRAKAEPVDIVFTDRPGPGNECLFVEVERDGRGIRYGEWIDRPDGMAALRIPGVPAADRDAIYQAVVERLTDEQHERLCHCDGWPDACISSSHYTRHWLEPNGTEDTINALAELGYLRACPAGESGDNPGEAKRHPTLAETRTGTDWCPACNLEAGTSRYADNGERCAICGELLIPLPAPFEEPGETR
jgi:hypothetical protein